MAICGFCKKEITKEDVKKIWKECMLRLRGDLHIISCPHCDKVIGTAW